MDQSKIKCCCGRPDCAYLQHNNAALQNLEKDVDTAARLGQALLGRHESYMAEAEADRARMAATIDNLEKQKREVQAENAKIIQENKDLLEDLEGLNNVISESDAHIKVLSTSLETAQLEVRRLTAAASRAALLEAQLNEMENDQARLEQSLAITQENERSAIQRWRKAEITLRDLHEQVDRIEKESREERERHVELLGRMERKRSVERELHAAAGRLKGAAAAASLGRNKNGTNVVSHFVKDILQDNANLQLNIVELKELLQSSDEEVRNLREQLLVHQPLVGDPDGPNFHSGSLFLSEELQNVQSAPQEFHIHHHYHTAVPVSASRKDRSQPAAHRRQRRRKALFPPTLLESPTKESSESPLSVHDTIDTASPASTFQTSPSSRTNRWVDQTPGPTFPSAPSSPASAYKAASIFDRSDLGFDSSRPTSPESGFTSPLVRASHRKGPSDTSIRSVLEDGWLDNVPSTPAIVKHSQNPRSLSKVNIFAEADGTAGGSNACSLSGLPIPEEHDDNEASTSYHHSGDQIVVPLRSPQLRRSTSHESLLSISGMDIHLTSNYSASSTPTFVPRTPRRIASAGTIFSSTTPVISRTNVTIPRVSISKDKSPLSLLSSVASAANPTTSATPVAQEILSESSTPQDSQSKSIKRRMGGWVLGKWTSTPPKYIKPKSTTTPETSSSTSHSSLPSTTDEDVAKSLPPVLFRPPGVNQSGPIFGLRPPDKAPTSVHPEHLDETLLHEALAE
ncbi:hypothetical protein CPC735_042100 [Coccidioides posadasii C735 delta SOWgp]|uniref:Uncharacterized protein n=1 Tax=Coccidioides posadasii (strain C735) TaxID=222929 RepID=C5PAY2_COCP7|nr:hypothetical protein CPC735_042100 [Coccidioides posadasii C735 delta SOWgp]EER25766.1 hypothetical protein CPC735_042100 [Coccidioides posadasii C735 delta SOWgp]|eukprot:XP_003067911.1 hypothetical protein CPC735_042100 [Coccidioides posadasii C735 delta SOWgp]